VLNFGDIVSGRELSGSDEVCEYPMALEYFPVFRAAGWTLWSRRIWCKPGAAVGSSRHCIGTNRAASNFEHIWTWKSPGKSIITNQTTGEFASQNGWYDSTHGVHLDVGLKQHGAGMPTTVARFGITNHSRRGRIVHEAFCGTGTTLIACEMDGRICYAAELEPAYVDLAITRWQMFTGRKAVLASDGRTFDEIAFERLKGVPA
jgi:DNA modification methylase